MLSDIILRNWDLFVLGIVIIATVVLGFIVYFKTPKSPTQQSFLGFALFVALWGACNYLSYRIQPASVAFAIIKFTLFSVSWETYYFLKFSIVFPSEEVAPRRKFDWVLLGTTWVVSLLTLTSFVFDHIESVASDGTITQIVNGPALPLFGIVSVGFTLGGVILLLRKTLMAKGEQRKPYRLISVGVLLMFALIITSNFILPVFFNDVRYIKFGALFVFPFVALTSYAIIKNRIFNVKVISSELFIATLILLSLLQLIQSSELFEIILRSGIFMGLLAVGILLIKSVLLEVEQREKLQELSGELQKANTELEKLSRFKTQLLSLVSHQIRSPLSAIKGFVSLLMDGTYGRLGAKPNEALGKVKMEADELVALVNDLLDFRKVEEGRMEYKFEPTDVVKLTKDVVEGLRPLATGKKLELTAAFGEMGVLVSADAQKLRQVILNLVDNAIKYTPAGFVKLELKAVGDKVVISVTDSGLGMTPDLITHVFEEFVRGETVKRTIRGTGLGLYIAKSIVEAHGGRIWAESQGDGKGSTFFVELKKI